MESNTNASPITKILIILTFFSKIIEKKIGLQLQELTQKKKESYAGQQLCITIRLYYNI